MDNDLMLGAHRLARGSTRRLHAQRGRSVECLSGTLWVTQDGDLRDVVLEAGEGFELDRAGDALLSALADSRWLLAAPCAAAPH